jgi:CheY-like chemotaxis protein
LNNAPSERRSIKSQPSAPVVLIVEDEWLLRDAMAEELQRADWSVLEASTAESALTLLRDGRQIDLVVTDIQLGGHLSGWDVAEASRAVHPEIPVIYVSGNSVDESRRVSDSIFLSKPYRIAALLGACRELAGSRQPAD